MYRFIDKVSLYRQVIAIPREPRTNQAVPAQPDCEIERLPEGEALLALPLHTPPIGPSGHTSASIGSWLFLNRSKCRLLIDRPEPEGIVSLTKTCHNRNPQPRMKKPRPEGAQLKEVKRTRRLSNRGDILGSSRGPPWQSVNQMIDA